MRQGLRFAYLLYAALCLSTYLSDLSIKAKRMEGMIEKAGEEGQIAHHCHYKDIEVL